MGANWNGDFICWPFDCDRTDAANRINEENRLRFLMEYYTRYPDDPNSPRSELDMDYFEWDPDL